MLDEDESVFYGCIIDALRERKVGGLPADEGRKRTAKARGFQHNDFRAAYTEVTEYITRKLPKISKVRKVQLYKLLALTAYDMVVDDYDTQISAHRMVYTRKRTLEVIKELRGYIHNEDGLAILDELQTWFQPVGRIPFPGLRSVLQCLQDPDTVVEAALPGYLRSGPEANKLLMEALR